MTAREDRPDVGGSDAPSGQPWALPTLRIDVSGDWFDDDVEITHPGILANLRAGLRRDAQGYFLQTRVRIPVAVADAPFVVTRFARSADGFGLFLNDGTQEALDLATLRLGPGEIPYCTVKGGAFQARFSRAAAWQLLRLAEYDEATGQGVLRQGAREHALRRSG
jgi:hypothetical protein